MSVNMQVKPFKKGRWKNKTRQEISDEMRVLAHKKNAGMSAAEKRTLALKMVKGRKNNE